MSSLYHDLLLDHYRHPRNHGSLPSPTHASEAKNPTCGDAIHMDIMVRHGKIRDVRFQGVGCAISQASASLLTEYVKGKTVTEIRALSPEKTLELLGVPLSPTRMKCALLALETLKRALGH